MLTPRLHFGTFASKLSFYLLLLTTAIFVCIALLFGHQTAKRANSQAVLYSSALLDKLLDDTELQLKDVEHMVDVVKSPIENDIDNHDVITSWLTNMVNRENLIMGGSVALVEGVCQHHHDHDQSLFMEYVFLDNKGDVKSKEIDGKDYDYSHMAWFTSALQSKKAVWSEPYFDEGAGNRLMTTYSMPLINDSGDVYGVLTADVSIEEFVGYINEMQPYDDGYTFIISSTGAYISHPDSTVVTKENIFSYAQKIGNAELSQIGRKMTSQQVGSAAFTMNGERMLACYAPIRSTGWSACYICPFNSITDALGNISIYIYMILLVGLILLSILIRRIVLRQTRPMTLLTEAAYKMSTGNFDTPLPVISTDDELQKLHDGFIYMQSSLKKYIEQLTDMTRTKERIASELAIAHNIQMSLLPHRFSPFADYPQLDIYAMLNPAKEVGGDFFDFVLRDGKLFFTVGDVSGKGVPAALIMATTRSGFRIFCETSSSPAKIVEGLNNQLCHNNETCIFVTAFVGVIDIATRQLTYCNAGHNPAAIANSTTNSCQFLNVDANLPLGVAELQYTEQQFTLTSDTTLLLYTDGLTEAERSDSAQYGNQQLLETMATLASKSSKEIIESLHHSVTDFAAGAEQSDDLTILCIKLSDNTTSF